MKQSMNWRQSAVMLWKIMISLFSMQHHHHRASYLVLVIAQTQDIDTPIPWEILEDTLGDTDAKPTLRDSACAKPPDGTCLTQADGATGQGWASVAAAEHRARKPTLGFGSSVKPRDCACSTQADCATALEWLKHSCRSSSLMPGSWKDGPTAAGPPRHHQSWCQLNQCAWIGVSSSSSQPCL